MTNTEKAITEFLFIGKDEKELGAYDLVLVLGNDDPKGTVDYLFDLYDKGHFSENCTVLLSGNRGSLNQTAIATEARAMYDEIKARGIDFKNIILEEEATNTLENFKFSKNKLENINAYQAILVVGKAFLMRRALMCALTAGFDEGKLTFFGTVDAGKNIGGDTWFLNEEAKKRVFEELERIGRYAAKGDLST